MRSKFRSALTILFLLAIAATGSLAWAAHGHGGGGGGGSFHGGGGSFHGGGGSFHGSSFHGSSAHFSGNGNFHGNFSHNNFDHGHFDHGHFDGNHFHFNGWPFVFGFPYWYNNYGYPGGYYSYGYPTYYDSYPSGDYSYPSDYYGPGADYYGEASPPQAYAVSRPVGDVARLQVRLSDPQAKLWVQGKEITSSGNVRQFQSPQLDASHKYTYTVKAEWNDNGKLTSDERKVSVRANAFSLVDFTKPAPTAADAQGPELPALPPPQQQPGDD